MEFQRRTVWVEESVGRPRMADPVRAAAVRAVLTAAFALVQAVTDAVLAVGHSWLSAPLLLSTVLTSVIATWAVLDVWVTRQVWNQRNGVVSTPSSAARTLRRERRRARRAARRAGSQPGAAKTPGPGGAAGRRHEPRHLGV
jgi:hypothetical protein